MKITRRKIIITIVIALAGFGLWRWQISEGKQQGPTYTTAQVEKGTIISTVSASGQVLTTNIVTVTTQATGVIKAVFAKDGDQVKSGAKIAEIELDREGQQKYASAWSGYLGAKKNLSTAETETYTLKADLMSKEEAFEDVKETTSYSTTDERVQFHEAESNFLAAEAKYKNQQTVIDQARASLNNAWLSYQATSPILTAPLAGVVSNISVVPGMGLTSTNQTTTSSQRVAVIQNEAKPIIRVNLTEIDVPKVKIDQKATVTLDSLPDKTFTGKVAAVDRIGTTSNNVTSYPSLIQLDIASSEILPNMATNANIIIETKSDVLLVPSTAIQTQAGQSYVRILRDDREQQVPVEIGVSSDTQTGIISGLSEGDEVITGTVATQTQQRGGTSIFGGGGFGGVMLRPGGARR